MSNSEIVSRAYDAFNHKDFEALIGLVAENCSWNVAGPSDIPWAGHFEGPDQVREFCRKLTDNVHFQTFAPGEFIEQGEKVVVCGSEKAVVANTGKDYTNLWAHVFTIQNGKIAAFQQYQDTAEIEAAVH